MNAEQFFNNGFGADVEKVHRKHVIELMTNFAKHYHTEQCNIPHVSGSVFTQDEENELQRLVRKTKYKQPTIDDMKKADELTRKKWKAEGVI